MRTIPGLSIDTKMLSDRLALLPVGETLPYEDLSSVIGRDVRTEARSNLTSAMHRLLSEGVVFAAVRGIGIKRLTDEEIVGIGPETVAKVRRAARRAGTKLSAVQDFAALPATAQTQHNMSMSVLGVLLHLTKPKTIRQLEARIGEAQAALPLQRTLEALGKMPEKDEKD